MALSGGFVNYYLVQVLHPQRVEQPPYQAECEDIIRALNMTFDEGCEFKAIWRTAAARLGNGKPGQKELYDAEKRVHYATASLRAYQRLSTKPEPVTEVIQEPLKISGSGLNQEENLMGDGLRGSGRTTRLIAQGVVNCLAKPGEWVGLSDHWGPDDIVGNHWVAKIVSAQLTQLMIPHERKFDMIKVEPIK